MKNTELFLMLQLFAESSTDPKPAEPGGTDPVITDPKPAEPKPQQDPKPQYTEEDIRRIISQELSEWTASQQKHNKEAIKLENMNAQERAEYERDQLQKQLESYKEKETLTEMTGTARKMLSESNITVSDELLSMMVSTDAGQTKKAVDSFTKAFTDAVETAVKERLRGEPPKKGSSGKATMTKEQIMTIQDPELRQQKMLENRELFNF